MVYVTYFAMLLFAVLYTYFTGSQLSMLMVYILVLCVPISYYLTRPLRERFEISLEIPSGEVEKNGIIRIKIRICNKSFLPVPFVHIKLLTPELLTILEAPSGHLSFSPHETKCIEARFHADYRGVAQIGLKEVKLKDYLGFSSFSLLQGLDMNQYTGNIAVLPKISPLKPSSKILQGANDKGNRASESESIGSPVTALIGEPGHEYREYQMGDPLHRVHWKLSARTEQLMVRVGEGMGTSRICLILDPCRQPDTGGMESQPGLRDPLKQTEDTLLEALLSVIQMIIRLGRHAEVWIYHKERWQMKTITHRKELFELQRLMAEYSFLPNNSIEGATRLPLSSMAQMQKMNRSFNGGEAILFTASYDLQLQKEMERVQSISLKLIQVRQGIQPFVMPLTNSHSPDSKLLWVLNAGEDFTNVAI